MIHQLFSKLNTYYTSSNRWWLPLLTGIPFALCLPPFNHELHWVFAPFPFLSFIALLPLFYFAQQKSFKRALLHTYLFSYTAALGQCFWVAFVKIEGLWGIIIFSMFLLAGYVALFFCAAGMIFRWCNSLFPRLSLLLFPAFWVLIDYLRTLGELAFPWEFLGYSLTPIIPLSQLASVTGIWGLTFLIVMGNVLFLKIGKSFYCKRIIVRRNLFAGAGFVLLIVGITVWGSFRSRTNQPVKTAKVALLQPAIDQLKWGNYSLEESFTVFDSMVYTAAASQPDVIVGPESALLCFLARQGNHRKRMQQWADSIKIPLILGAIHWDKAPGGSVYDFLVYNTAFMARPGERDLLLYRKIKLVPFSEAFPFEAKFPILSRVNLGEADFKRGNDQVVYEVSPTIKAAIFVCYESIFPGFVQKRLSKNANIIFQITNDGWFGKTTGPYQHAIMARMRSIENRVATARCAITGISMFIDPFGRVIKETRLDKRAILEHDVPLQRAATFYSRFGDWFVLVCGGIAGASVLLFCMRKFRA